MFRTDVLRFIMIICFPCSQTDTTQVGYRQYLHDGYSSVTAIVILLLQLPLEEKNLVFLFVLLGIQPLRVISHVSKHMGEGRTTASCALFLAAIACSYFSACHVSQDKSEGYP